LIFALRVNGERDMPTNTQPKHGESKMPIDVHSKRRGKTPEEIASEQRQQAAALKAQKQQHNAVPAKVGASTPAPQTIDTRSIEDRYVDEIAPSSFAGERVRFTKDAKFVVGDGDEEIGPDVDLVALLDETLVGWVRFNGEGEMPTRIMGPRRLQNAAAKRAS
jgi:hypothetical protein